MKKRLFAVLLCLIMVLALLPATAFAAEATSVWIAGEELTSVNPYYHNGIAGMPGEVNNIDVGYSAYFNAGAGTLTLDGLSVLNSTQTKTIGAKTFTYAIFADGDLTINVIGDSAVSTDSAAAGNENVALYVNGDVTFGGTAGLAATSGTGESTFGVYILGNLEVLSGTLSGAAKAAGGAATVNAKSYGVNAMGTLIVFGGKLVGTSGTATATANSISAGIGETYLSISGGEVTATGNTATAAYALSYGLYVSSFDISDGTANAQGSTATGGDGGSFSAGAVARDVAVSGGTFTAQGGRATATGTARSQSYGIYVEADLIDFSGGTVEATGGEAGYESCGIKNAGNRNNAREYISGGAITVSGAADVTANGGYAEFCYGLTAYDDITVNSGKIKGAANGTAPLSRNYGVNAVNGHVSVTGGSMTCTAVGGGNDSCGLFASGNAVVSAGSLTATAAAANITSNGIRVNGFIAIYGGELTAKSESARGSMSALHPRVELFGVNLSAKGSISSDGSNPGNYVAANNYTYKWVYISPPPTVSSVAVNPASVSVEKGGTQTFYATVTGSYSPTQTVTWSVTGNTSASTTISADGELTVAAAETATTLTVKAISTLDTAKSGTATVTVTYRIIQGAGGSWTKGGASGLGFTADAEYSKFTGYIGSDRVTVDGENVSSDNYTSQEGSTIVMLKPAYLQTLSAGNHTLRINFTGGGYAETYFTIASPAAAPGRSNPSTGFSETDSALWLSAALLAGAGLAAGIYLRRRKENR